MERLKLDWDDLKDLVGKARLVHNDSCFLNSVFVSS